MMSLIRRVPVEAAPMSRLMNQFFNDPFFTEFKGVAVPEIDEGTLALDVSEDEKDVIVRASLPGFDKKDVEVEVHDGVLSIKAEHTEETEVKNEKFYRKERRFGSVSRRVALPGAVLDTDTKAELKDGVLSVRVPKAQKEQPKKVKIS